MLTVMACIVMPALLLMLVLEHIAVVRDRNPVRFISRFVKLSKSCLVVRKALLRSSLACSVFLLAGGYVLGLASTLDGPPKQSFVLPATFAAMLLVLIGAKVSQANVRAAEELGKLENDPELAHA